MTAASSMHAYDLRLNETPCSDATTRLHGPLLLVVMSARPCLPGGRAPECTGDDHELHCQRRLLCHRLKQPQIWQNDPHLVRNVDQLASGGRQQTLAEEGRESCKRWAESCRTFCRLE